MFIIIISYMVIGIGPFFKKNAVAEIIKLVLDNPGITYEELIIKAQVNAPFAKETTASNIIRLLILDKVMKVEENGVVKLCRSWP
jgi:hypothetical protein